jgi:hypothetical protein
MKINTTAAGAIHWMTSGLSQIENVIGPLGGGGEEGGGPLTAGAGAVDVMVVNGGVAGDGAAGVGGTSVFKAYVSGVGSTGAGVAGGAAGRPGTVKVPAHRGHFISCPAYCSGTVSIF